METIKISTIREEIKNTDYLSDFLNDYFVLNKEEYTTEELKEVLNENYLSDKVTEFADSNVDIYTHDLLEWLKDNYTTYDESMQEMGDQ